MDQSRLSDLIGRGLAVAGGIVGAPFVQYRPSSTTAPISGTALATVSGILDPDPDLSLRNADYRHGTEAAWIGDPSTLAEGDYLVGARTCFVSQIEPLRPPSCIICNRTLSIYQPATASATGTNAYGGRTTGTDTLIASSWPAGVLPKTHIEIDPTRLPSDVKTSFFDIALPASLDLILTYGLLLLDDYGQSYLVSTAALTVGGWRLIAGIETT